MTSVETIVAIANGKTARVGVPLSRSLNFLKIRDVNDLSFHIKGRFSKAAVSGQNYTTVYEGMTFDTGKHGDFDCVELLNESGVDLTITVLCSDGVILDFVGQKGRDSEASDLSIVEVLSESAVIFKPSQALMLTCSIDLTNNVIGYFNSAFRVFLRTIEITASPRSTASNSYDFWFKHSALTTPIRFWRGSRAAGTTLTPTSMRLEVNAVVNTAESFAVGCTTANTDFVLIVRT